MVFKVFYLILVYSLSAQASVLSVSPSGRFHFNQRGAIELCWASQVSAGTLVIEQQVQQYVQAQLQGRAGLLIEFTGLCLEQRDPFFPIGLGFFDDPATQEGIRSEIKMSASHSANIGQPMTFAKGEWANRQLVDINLSSRFLEVSLSLQKQRLDLSEAGVLNLQKSIALHEVLHALGFAHEQSHRDSVCTEGEDRYKPRLHTLLTEYDPHSIMNYCETHSYEFEKGPMPLTPLDIVGLQKIYRTHEPMDFSAK